MAGKDLTGRWHSKYKYHETDIGEHTVNFVEDQNGSFAGTGAEEDGSKINLVLEHDKERGVLTGTWKEYTSPYGEYTGQIFHGTLQLILDESGNTATGTWTGFNRDVTKVNTGEWTLSRLKETEE